LHNYYNNSLQAALKDLYPEHTWYPWQFKTVHRNFWTSIENQRAFLEHVAQQMGIQDMEGWYDVTQLDLQARHGSGLLAYYKGNVAEAVMKVFPTHSWDPLLFVRCIMGTILLYCYLKSI
jgi:hypothetical protein